MVSLRLGLDGEVAMTVEALIVGGRLDGETRLVIDPRQGEFIRLLVKKEPVLLLPRSEIEATTAVMQDTSDYIVQQFRTPTKSYFILIAVDLTIDEAFAKLLRFYAVNPH